LIDRLADAEALVDRVIEDVKGPLQSTEVAGHLAEVPQLLRDARAALEQYQTELSLQAQRHALIQQDQQDSLRKVAEHRRNLEETIQEAHVTTSVLGALVATLPVGLVVAGPDGMILTTNKAGEEILGGRVTGSAYKPHRPYRIKEIDGVPFQEEQETPLYGALSRGESLKDVELSIETRDGRDVVVLASAAPFRNDRNEIIGAVTVFQDITEVKAEANTRSKLLVDLKKEKAYRACLTEELQRERDILEAIMANTQTQLAYLDTDFNFLAVNSAYARGAGYDAGELVGRNHFDLFPDEQNEAIFRDVLDSGEPMTFEARPFEYQNRPELGVTYWDWSLVPVTDGQGTTHGLVLSLRDVTERHRFHREITDLARYPQENPYPVLRVGAQGRLLYANPGSAELLDAWGIEVGQLIPLPWRTKAQDAIRTQTLITAEMSCEDSIFSMTITPSEEDYANIYGLNVTNLRQAQRALRQYADRLQTLHQIDQDILSAQSIDAIADAALARIPQMIDCVYASIVLFDFDTDEVELLTIYPNPPGSAISKGSRAPLSHGWSDQIKQLRQGHEVLVKGVEATDPALPSIEPSKEGVVTILRQPLLAHGALIGALNLGLSTSALLPNEFSELARELADQLAIAIQQTRLHSRIQDHAQHLERRVAWRTAALRISEARFRAIFEDAPTGIALLDQEGRVIQSNGALASVLGQPTDNLQDTVLRELMHPDDAAKEKELYVDLMDGKLENYRIESRFIQPKRRRVWCNMIVSLVRDVEHQPRLAIAMIEDITEARKAQMALVQTEKLALTGQLAASLAHEINNPLQTVIGCLGLADETAGDEEPLATYLGMASDELKRAAGIVGRLRDLNRTSKPEEREPTQLVELIENILVITRKKCQERHIKVISDLPGDLPPVPVVANRIQQVLLNLVLNAIDAMPGGGTLSMSAKASADQSSVMVRLRDTGIGIPSDQQDHLFDPFYTTKPEGLGLGLYISQTIVEDHGGHIEVESQPGVGTVFSIHLPVPE
jgi:PAS domain S-box-containing protein